MKTLISMTDFVLFQWNYAGITDEQKLRNCAAYALFLKQPLTLGMFVPCDENGNVLEEPKLQSELLIVINDFMDKMKVYNEAKERVLFKEFKFIEKWGGFHRIEHFSGNTLMVRYNHPISSVEWLIKKMLEIELTDSAIKQIFG